MLYLIHQKGKEITIMVSYDIVLKFCYTVENVVDEKEAYEKAIEMVKSDTHPEPYDWGSYYLKEE